MASKLVAEKYAVSRAWVDRLKPRRRETGEIAPRRQTRWRTPRLPAQLPRLAILIREQPDRTLVEWQQALPTSASLPMIWRAVTKLGCRLKKNGARDRTRHRQVLAHDDLARRTARDRPHGPRRLRRSDRWRELPRLHRTRARTDAAPRRRRRVGQSVGASGVRRCATLCFLPKYSPDLNPIEWCFAKLQTILRVARCRAREELWATIGACVPRFAPTECRNYFRHYGDSVATRS